LGSLELQVEERNNVAETNDKVFLELRVPVEDEAGDKPEKRRVVLIVRPDRNGVTVTVEDEDGDERGYVAVDFYDGQLRVAAATDPYQRDSDDVDVIHVLATLKY
jgi:hypothetical protein